MPTMAVLPAWMRQRIGRSTQTVDGLSPEAALHARRNFQLGVLNGVLFALVNSLIAASFVLAFFVNRLGGPNVLVGLIPAIATGGAFLPQIFVASKVQGQKLVMHWYRRIGLIRIACIALLALSVFFVGNQPQLMLVLFFVFYAGYCFGGGLTTLPWYEMVSKVIAPRRREIFFSLRAFWGGLLGLLASVFISAILSEQFSGLKFPYNFAVLFGITTIVVAGGIWAWTAVHEPPAINNAQPATLAEIFKRGASAVRVDRDYRSFMLARLLLALVTISDPFYVVFAKEKLGAPAALVGLYLGASAAAGLLSNFVWGPMADRANNRTLMVVTVISVALVPLAALAVPMFLGGLLPADALLGIFTVVFVLGGLAAGSARIVNNNMLLAIAPPAERATYIGFLNLLLGLVTFIPVLGGALVDALGFTILFSISLIMAALAMLASTRLSRRSPYEV